MKLNINGTEGGMLLQERMDALAAIETAIDHVSKLTVHMRDYQTMPDGSARWQEASRAKRLQLDRLHLIKAEIEGEAIGLSEQLRERHERGIA